MKYNIQYLRLTSKSRRGHAYRQSGLESKGLASLCGQYRCIGMNVMQTNENWVLEAEDLGIHRKTC